MKEINITSIEGFRTGSAQDHEKGTGCTVVIFDNGAAAGLDIRGGGPASRETQLLNPLAAAQKIHAVYLCGGSAFGLDSAAGVMNYLSERGIGYDTGIAKIPLVCASGIFDLLVGSRTARPNAAMAYSACMESEKSVFTAGNTGAGCGATVGKYMGASYMMKSGIGSFAIQLGDIKVGAIMVVNALGDIYGEDGKIIAGMLDKNGGFASTDKAMYEACGQVKDLFNGNTTIGVVITNAGFDKTALCKIASMANNGMARAISPVHTMADGDSIYAVSTGNVKADINSIGQLAALAVRKAIINAAMSATEAYGLKCAKTFSH